MRRGADPEESREVRGRRSSPRAAAGVLLALLAGPMALGLLARAGPWLVDRFTAWWPPREIGLMPLAVAGLVVFITAFALATRGSRARRPRSTTRRRFLPPLDLLLLQLGNVSFLAFALILAVVALGMLSAGLRLLVRHPRLEANHLALSLGLAAVAAVVSFAVRARRVRSGRWQRRAALLGLAAAGLWLLAELVGPAAPSQPVPGGRLPPTAQLALHALVWIVLAASALAARVTRPGMHPGDRQGEGGTRGTVLLLTWVGYLGFLALYLDGALLAVRSLLAQS